MAEENVNAIKQKVVEKHKLQFKKPKAQIITIETNSSPMREFGAKKVPNSSLDFQDEAQLKRYLAQKSYGHAYGVHPKHWEDHHKNLVNSGRFKVDTSEGKDLSPKNILSSTTGRQSTLLPEIIRTSRALQ